MPIPFPKIPIVSDAIDTVIKSHPLGAAASDMFNKIKDGISPEEKNAAGTKAAAGQISTTVSSGTDRIATDGATHLVDMAIENNRHLLDMEEKYTKGGNQITEGIAQGGIDFATGRFG